jgi:hypothetical protein
MEKSLSSAFRIDENVFYMMALASIVPLIILGFNVINYVPCNVLRIEIKASNGQVGKNDDNFSINKNILFEVTTQSKDATHCAWDFGDGTRIEGRFRQKHAYTKPGKYIIVVKVNDKCAGGTKVYVMSNLMPELNIKSSNLVDSEDDLKSDPIKYNDKKVVPVIRIRSAQPQLKPKIVKNVPETPSLSEQQKLKNPIKERQ